MSEPTTLYRAYNDIGDLLYIGIGRSWARRWMQHSERSPFYVDVAQLRFETYPTRGEALEAERAAIQTERPLHNVVHNGARSVRRRRPPPIIHGESVPPGVELWTWRSLRSGYERTDPLWLYPEINGMAAIHDCYWSDDGETQLTYWVDWLERNHSDAMAADAIPIFWSVQPCCECAPFTTNRYDQQKNFLTELSWPMNARTGEPVNWFQLPVIYSRFPAFGEALGWKPAPFQPHAPMASILRSRSALKPVVSGSDDFGTGTLASRFTPIRNLLEPT